MKNIISISAVKARRVSDSGQTLRFSKTPTVEKIPQLFVSGTPGYTYDFELRVLDKVFFVEREDLRKFLGFAISGLHKALLGNNREFEFDVPGYDAHISAVRTHSGDFKVDVVYSDKTVASRVVTGRAIYEDLEGLSDVINALGKP
mgnify:CR=1 FL=1